MDFGSIGSARVDLEIGLSKLPGQFTQAREQVMRLATGIEAAIASGHGFEGLSDQVRRLAPAVLAATTNAQSLQEVTATLGRAIAGTAPVVAQLAQHFGALQQTTGPAVQGLVAVTAATTPAAQGLRNVAAEAGAAGGAIGGGGGGVGAAGGGLAGAAGSAGGAFGVLNTSLASFAGYLSAIAVRKVVGDLEALGSTAITDAEQWQLAAQKIQFSLGLTREAALRERAALMDASRGQPFGGTVQLATFLGPSVLEMGKTRVELNGLIKELGQLAIVSGSTGEQAQRSFTQLGQAFAIGKLQGQDLRALTQDMPALFEAIVRGSGKSREALMEMAHAVGGIPVSLVFEALQKEAPAVADAFSKMGSTVTVGMTDVKNAFLEAVGNSGAATDAVNTLGSAFEDLAGFMRSADFQTALAPFATFIHDLGEGLSASVRQVHEVMDALAKAAAEAPGSAPNLDTSEGLTAHAKAIGEGLANPPPLPVHDPVVEKLLEFRDKHLNLPEIFGGDPSKNEKVFDVPKWYRENGAGLLREETAPGPSGPGYLGGAVPPAAAPEATPPPRIDVEGWSSLHSAAAEAQSSTAYRPANWLTDAWGKYQGSGNPMAWPSPPPPEGPPEGAFQPGGPDRYQYERMEAISATPTLSQTLAARGEGAAGQLAGVTAAAGVVVSVLRELGLPTPPFSARATPTGAELPEIGGEHALRIYPPAPPEGENQPGGPGRLPPGALTWEQVADGLRAIGVLSRPGPSDEDYRKMEADSAPPPPPPTPVASAAQQAELAAARRYDVPPTAEIVSERERMWDEERVRRARADEVAPPAAAYPGAAGAGADARPPGLADEVRSATDRLLEGLKAAPGEVAQAWRDAAARTAPTPLGMPAVEAAGADAAKTAAEARASADQETAAKARESGTAQEQAGQQAREAGAAQGAVASSGERVVGSFVTLAAAAHRLEAMLGGVVLPPDGTPKGDGAAKGQGGPAGKPEAQAGPTRELLAEAKKHLDEAQQYVTAHMTGVGDQKAPTTELAASYRAILLDVSTSVVEKARKIQGADLQEVASREATRRAESIQHSFEQRGDRLTPVTGQEDIVQTQAAISKREAANKELVAQREELARLKALEKDALASPGLVSPERLSAIQASRAETQGKVTALEQRERAQQLATFTHGSEQEASSAAGRIYDKTTTTDPRAAILLQIKQDKAGIAASSGAKDAEGVGLATKTLLADQQRLAQYDQQRKDALQSQSDAVTGQTSATARLAGEMDKIARLQRTQPGDPYPALRTPAAVATAKEGAYKRFAEGLVTESGKDTQGKPERGRDEAAISVLLAAETTQVGARAALEEKIAQLRSRIGELDKADLDKLEAQNATIEASLAKSEAKLSRLKAGAGGDISGAIDDAREAAQLSVPVLTKDEAASRYGPKAEGDRDVQREKAGDIAASTEFERQRQAALKSVATAETSYIEVVKEADARRKAGLLTEQQYNRAVQGTITPLQAYREEMARIGAVEANVNLAVLKGTMSLDERRRKMLQLEADKGRAAAGERSATSRDLYDRGEAGSGTPFGKEVGGGALAGGLDIISQYGNAAKDAGELTKSFFEGTADAMTQFVMTGKADLAGLGVSLEQMALKMTIQLVLARALSAAFGAIGGGGAAAAPSPYAGFGDFAAGGWQGAAHGMAMEGGDRVPMATGGILSRETMIPMAHGGWADAGEQPGNTEAVMPLRRNSRGDLSVQTDAVGGGGAAPSIVINNHGEPVGQSDTKWDPDSRTLEVTIRKMVDNNIAGGAHNRAMKTAFGLSPTVRR